MTILFLQEVNYKAKHPFSKTEQRKWNKHLNDEGKDSRGQCSKDSLLESRIKAESQGKEPSYCLCGRQDTSIAMAQ